MVSFPYSNVIKLGEKASILWHVFLCLVLLLPQAAAFITIHTFNTFAIEFAAYIREGETSMITTKSPGLPNNRGFDHTCFVNAYVMVVDDTPGGLYLKFAASTSWSHELPQSGQGEVTQPDCQGSTVARSVSWLLLQIGA